MFISKIKENCLKLREKTAYICADESITFGELWEKASSLAAYLQKDGEGPVIVYGHKSPYMLVSFLACVISGRAYVPCDTSMPLLRIEYIISEAKAGIMLATETPEPEKINILDLEALEQICGLKKECALIENENSTAYIIFTSGSTGKPKGVPISIKNLDNFIFWVTRIPAISGLHRGTVFNQAAFSFDLSVADIYISLVCGHTLFAVTRHEQEDFALLFKRLKQSGSSLIVCTPTFMQMCLCDSAFKRDLLPELKTVFFCGEVLPVKTARRLSDRFSGIRIINAYGPTEATCAVCAVVITDDMLDKSALPVGKIATAAVQISIVGGKKENTHESASAHGSTCAQGSACAQGRGEILLYGDSVSAGYLGGQSDSFKNGGYFLTGDIGKIENGYLYYLGRKDGQVKYKGYRIEPAEIEHCISEIDGIISAAVIPVKGHGDRIFMLAAFAEKTFAEKSAAEKSAGNITAQFVKAELSKKLPDYMIPKTITFIDKMPMNANGKCDRKTLMEGILNERNS